MLYSCHYCHRELCQLINIVNIYTQTKQKLSYLHTYKSLELFSLSLSAEEQCSLEAFNYHSYQLYLLTIAWQDKWPSVSSLPGGRQGIRHSRHGHQTIRQHNRVRIINRYCYNVLTNLSSMEQTLLTSTCKLNGAGQCLRVAR